MIIIMRIFQYKSVKSIMIAACHKSGKSIITSLIIIIKIKFICFSKNEVDG